MARIQQDQFIDEDEEDEVCPLCVEEFDLVDRYFKPCPCGYQICQFCYNNIKTTMNGLCPACRRPYDEKPYSFKNVTQEELLQHEKNKAAQQKKRAAAKQKEVQKREADNMSRKHLAGLRVRQRNLVYVTGIRPKQQGEKLVEALREKDYFGQYGDIIKIVVSKAKDAGHSPNQPVGIYVTFARKEDAAVCIDAINNNPNGDGKIRAQHGTTKYCSAYLRGEMCNNRSCMFLHEPGETAESFTRQDLSSLNAFSTQQTGSDPAVEPPPQQSQPVAAAAQDRTPSSPSGSTEAPALPSGATWASAARRLSQAASSSVASPVVMTAVPAQVEAQKSPQSKEDKPPLRLRAPRHTSAVRDLLRTIDRTDMVFNFTPRGISEEDLKVIETLPPLWDPQGGVKRRRMKEREAEELTKLREELAATAQNAPTEGNANDPEARGGSLQLGGEPDEQSHRAFAQGSAPSSASLAHSFLENDLANMNLRNSTSSQAAQHSQLLLRQLQSASARNPQIGQSHSRSQSKFGFGADANLMGSAALSQSKALSSFASTAQQPSFYNGAQGPPPGLKTTGTTPVNGGTTMFGQGHGFTSGYAGTQARDVDRARDPRQRELMFQFNTTAASTLGPGQINYPPFSNQTSATFHDGTTSKKRSTKSKKKGHGHNSASSGSGTIDSADPSLLQSRLHQNGMSGLAAQGAYGGLGQGGSSSMYNNYASRSGWQ